MKTLLLFMVLFANAAFALTAQQYCEKLHSKRPAGTNTSEELLNVEMGSETVVVTGLVVVRDRNYGGGEIGGDAAAIFGATPVVPYANTICYRKGEKPVFTVYTKTRKYCKDGHFRYKKEKVIAPFGSCTVAYQCGSNSRDDGDNSVTCTGRGAELGVSTFLIETNEP